MKSSSNTAISRIVLFCEVVLLLMVVATKNRPTGNSRPPYGLHAPGGDRQVKEVPGNGIPGTFDTESPRVSTTIPAKYPNPYPELPEQSINVEVTGLVSLFVNAEVL